MTSSSDRDLVVPRLLERTTLPAGPVPAHARPFSDDVLEVLVVDQSDGSRPLDDEEAAELGGWQAARDLAVRNLAGVVSGLEVHHLGNDEVGVTLVTSPSVFAASTVLLLPEVIAHAELGATPDGAFVATPSRSELLIHPLRDARSVPSLQVIAQMARAGFDQGVGPLSPHVHWWDGASFTQLTRIDDEGTRIEVGPELGEVLERIGG